MSGGSLLSRGRLKPALAGKLSTHDPLWPPGSVDRNVRLGDHQVGAFRRLRKVDGGSIERLRDLLTDELAEAAPQTHAPLVGQDPEKIVQGQVRSIDPAGTAITLTDGTRLLTPPGSSLRPGALSEGMTVIASYREQNGEKVMTELAVEEPSASPPADPRLPATPPTAPPRNSPPRY